MALYKHITWILLVTSVSIFADISPEDESSRVASPAPTSTVKGNVSPQTNFSDSVVTAPKSNESKPVNEGDTSENASSVSETLSEQPSTTDETPDKKSTSQVSLPNTNINNTQESTASIPDKVTNTVTQNMTNPEVLKPTTLEPVKTSSEMVDNNETSTQSGEDVTTQFTPVSFDTLWMNIFFSTHHFEGQYMHNGLIYLFDFVVRKKSLDDPEVLVTNFYDADGAVIEFNGRSDGDVIVFTSTIIYTPDIQFPLHEQFEMVGTFPLSDQPYFTGNFTKPINSSFTWFRMNKGLGKIETGETAGTRTAIVIIIPTSIAFLGICGTVAIICWASKKGYLRGRHKSYRLFTNAQVSYESEAETIHI